MVIKVMIMMHWSALHNKSSAIVMSRMRMIVMVMRMADEDDIGGDNDSHWLLHNKSS